MAEFVLGSAAFGNAARARRVRRKRAAAELPIFVGAMADEPAIVGLNERHKKVPAGRRRLAKCDRPPLTVCW